ncbi:hypothetical protein HPB48_005216 [Haemaphysalis longicornis]|uniref:Zinc finger PHD-type domain-containing protein n=1 Tax=Haemaphysalis longicornis TaxID=44386 RepID=A0A9J6FFZ6_HAELO|nr:hypothetical protein HPB48_005216 [Haemaphysalis longicornis]
MAENEMCIACQNTLSGYGRFMKCSDCNYFYHLGQNCSGISPNTFTTMGQGKRDVWVCKTCRASKKSKAPSSQPDGVPEVERPDSESAVLSELRSIRKNLEMLPALHEKVDSLLLLKGEFAGLSAQVHDLEGSVSFMSSQCDTVLAQSKGCHEQVSRCTKEVDDLKTAVHEQAAQIERLHDQLNDSEQYSRRENLEIHGMPVEQEEDLQQKLSHLADKLNLSDFSASGVLSVHRLPSKRDATPTILVRFASVGCTEMWLEHDGKLRLLHQSGALPKLFFNENLDQAEP